MDTETQRKERALYDEQYYSSGYGGPVSYERNEYWLGFFHAIADQVVRSLQPGRVLDAGCAKGFLVEALWERGVEAYGIDISEYAIAQVRRDMQAYCRRASLTEPIEGTFDLVTCLEVLEHISEAEVRQALGNLTSVTDTILFSSTPTELDEPTHVNVRPIISWLYLFAEFNFAPVLGFDASFVTPHAMLLRRAQQAPSRDVLILFADLIRYRLTLTDRHKKNAHLTNETERLRQQAELTARQIEDLQKEFKSSRDHTRNLEALREQDREQMRRDAGQIERLGSQLADVQSACQGATAQLEQSREEIVRQRQQLADTQGAYQVATAQLEQKRDEVMHLRQRLTEIQSAYQGAITQLEQSREEIVHQRQQLAHVQSTAQREQSREEILVRLQEIEKRDAELQTILKQYADLGGELHSKMDLLSVRLGSLESSVAGVARQTLDILHSKIWRTLCTAGAWLLGLTSVFHGRRPRRQPAPVESASRAQKDDSPAATESTESFDLVYDEPQAGIETARTGKIAVRGWALADTGVERIEIKLGTARAVTETGLIRVDVARSHPQAAGARTCGYATEIDSTGVPSGRHVLHITGVSRGGSVRELQTLVYINHETGFASDYDRWIAEFETRNPSLIQLKLRTFTLNPLISVAMPVYRTPLPVLTRAIESVLAQSYSRWELCIADDGSCSAEIESCLRQFVQRDSRIKVRRLHANGGIAHASNAALELATGDFVALLDHDDELAEDALYRVVEALNRQPDLDILYSDEDKIDEQGKRYDPFFKPDWSPDLLLSENYVAHLLVCRRSLLVDVGGFRSGFDGSQDYDLVLRLTGKSRNIGHIAGVLYHWRALATSTASRSDQKSYAADAARRAIEEHLTRCSIAAQVVPGIIDGRWRVQYRLAPEPMVSIIIASGGKTEILRVNLESLFGKTAYPNYEVVVIDNSKGEDIKKLVTLWPGRPLRYIDWRGQPFNYSTINNEAARQSSSPLLLFLNDDTSVIDAGWLTALVEIAAGPEVGAAGAKLLYPDGRIQHAGVVMGIFDNCGHAFKGLPGDMQHYFDFPDVIRNVSAVTGACLMTRAEVFREAGGFDERNFAVAFNDIDLCLKIREKGYRVVYTPHAVLYHHEAFSKTAKDLMPDPVEVQAMRSKWKQVIDADPYYSPNLTRTAEDYSLGRKPAGL